MGNRLALPMGVPQNVIVRTTHHRHAGTANPVATQLPEQGGKVLHVHVIGGYTKLEETALRILCTMQPAFPWDNVDRADKPWRTRCKQAVKLALDFLEECEEEQQEIDKVEAVKEQELRKQMAKEARGIQVPGDQAN